jgi:hypothetical protein
VRTRILALDERLTRLRVEKNRLLARASQTERKRDTRRKILIGGAVLAAIEHEGVPAMRSKSELCRWLDALLTRPHDRAVFDLSQKAGEPAKVRPSTYQPVARSEAAVKDADLGGTASAARSVLDGRVSRGQ